MSDLSQTAQRDYRDAVAHPAWIYNADNDQLTFQGQIVGLEDADLQELLVSSIQAGGTGYSLPQAMCEFDLDRESIMELFHALIQELRDIPFDNASESPANRPQRYITYSLVADVVVVAESLEVADAIKTSNRYRGAEERAVELGVGSADLYI